MAVYDPLLFGADTRTHIVAVEPEAEAGVAVLFRRMPDGSTEASSVPFVPWLLSASAVDIKGATLRPLTGTGHNFRYDFTQTGWAGFLEARRQLRQMDIPVVSFGSQVRQFLLDSGITLFKDMLFDNIRRMQIDIETTTLSPNDRNASIVTIAVSNNSGGIEVFDGDENEMLEELGDRIRRWDPDVIEGHNIYSFDLPYILARCKATGVLLAAGRDNERPVTVGSQRNCALGPNSRPFIPTYIYGRHILDTYFQVQRFDAAKGEISSYGLKECAQVYKLSSEERVIVDRTKVQEIHRSDPELLRLYARQDVEDTRALAALTSATEFYQTQMTPDVYQSVAVTGTGEKVNSLLIREYLRQGQSVPMSNASSEYPGGYTEIRKVGILRRVVKADVESLYPSLMLSEKIRPSSDTLNLFLPLLADLTARRLAAKAMLRQVECGTRDSAYWDGLQNSFKVLINSFYGYIGGPFYFNDFAAARQVTMSGQRIVKLIADELERSGSVVIEIDTDGIYFQPPSDVLTEEMEEAYVKRIGEVLPSGIRLAHDGRYAAMLSLKIKNYVLEHYDGHLTLKGSSLRSRADELFGRRFLNQAVRLLLKNDLDGLASLYNATLEQIQNGHMPIEEFYKRERVTDKRMNGPHRTRLSEIARSGQISEGDIISVYMKNDGSMGLASEYGKDEDRSHYAAKLHKFCQRLVDAVGEEHFVKLFPRPRTQEQRLTDKLQESFDF